MRFSCFTIFFFLCAFNFSDDIAIKNFYLNLSKKYCSDAYEIFKSESDYKKYTRYAKGETKSDWLKDFGTAVHETCHGYNFEIGKAKGFGYQGYFITSNVIIVVPQKSIYNSIELNRMIPDSIHKSIVRYDSYIGGDTISQITSKVNGIYGLLDEFSAYYHGTKAEMELFNYYDSLSDKNPPESWANYLKPLEGELYSYYEFKLFISWYLGYARKYHEQVYLDCMNNKPLRIAFTLLDDEWLQLQKDYLKKRNLIIEKLNQQGYKAAIEKRKVIIGLINGKEGHLYFFKVNGESIPLFDEKIEYLTTLLKDTSHQVLNTFRVEGVTIKNYQKYLEQ